MESPFHEQTEEVKEKKKTSHRKLQVTHRKQFENYHGGKWRGFGCLSHELNK